MCIIIFIFLYINVWYEFGFYEMCNVYTVYTIFVKGIIVSIRMCIFKNDRDSISINDNVPLFCRLNIELYYIYFISVYILK